MYRSIRIVLLLFAAFIGCYANAQNTFGTSHAVVDIGVHYEDSLTRLQSRNVKVALNYETAEFVMFINTSELVTLSDSSLNKVGGLKEKEFSYHGVFDLEYIKTKEHPPLSFEVRGDLELGKISPLKLIGKGDLVHVSDGAYPCQLSLEFRISAEELERKLEVPISFEYIDIKIQQVILKENFE